MAFVGRRVVCAYLVGKAIIYDTGMIDRTMNIIKKQNKKTKGEKS